MFAFLPVRLVQLLCQSLLLLLLLSAAGSTSPLSTRQNGGENTSSDDSYAPVGVACPLTPLVRPAIGLSPLEAAYRDIRYAKASASLVRWLRSVNSDFVVDSAADLSLPTLALTTSGGGSRTLLLGAGVIQAFDAREVDGVNGNTTTSTTATTAGLFQSLTYQAGLSGGAWLLSSIAGNDYPTVSYLRDELWHQAFEASLLVPENILASDTYSHIVKDLVEKADAGFPPTFTDPWGRLLAYQLLEGADGGVMKTMSGIADTSNFTSYNAPYPIITALGVQYADGECNPELNGTQYEFHPYEFGSWDDGVAAFALTHILGSRLSNGIPQNGTCVINYDNLGYVLGTSSTLFNQYFCPATVVPSNSSNASIFEFTAGMLSSFENLTVREEFAVYPNPFHNFGGSTAISKDLDLYLADGGEALQNNPIWPFLQQARGVDVIIVNDNSADNNENFPNGTEVLTTYQQAIAAGLDRMPEIPSIETFVSEGLNRRATFFGCNDDSMATIIYLPNVNYTYASNTSTSQFVYLPDETDAMIANGNAVATQNGTEGWATCLACGIMKKASKNLPNACSECFSIYCYN